MMEHFGLNQQELGEIVSISGLLASRCYAILVMPIDCYYATERAIDEAKTAQELLRGLFSGPSDPETLSDRWGVDFLIDWEKQNPDFGIEAVQEFLRDFQAGNPLGTLRVSCARDFFMALRDYASWYMLERITPKAKSPPDSSADDV